MLNVKKIIKLLKKCKSQNILEIFYTKFMKIPRIILNI